MSLEDGGRGDKGGNQYKVQLTRMRYTASQYKIGGLTHKSDSANPMLV